MLDGTEVQLAANNGANALHGGLEGFDRRNWRIVAIEDGDRPAVTLAYTSPDGEEGYPGTLVAEVTWRLTGPMELSLDMTARTDRPTVVNLTNHSFFNLAGARSGRNILDHHLTVAADHFLAIDAGAIPLPQPPSAVAERRSTSGPASRSARGSATTIRSCAWAAAYDHNFCLGPASGEPRFAARLAEPASGRVLELFTNQPGCRSIPETFSTAPPPERAAASIGSPTPCASNRTRGPIRPTGPISRPHGLSPGEVYRHTTLYRFTHAIQGAIHGAIETQSAVESPKGAGR
jgi:aldose 1-epimerase